MSKQSNEITSIIADGEDGDKRRSRTWAGQGRRDFALAKQHAEDLGLSPKVSDGVRRMMMRYGTSPLKHILDRLNDPGVGEATKNWAAEKALPYLHAKADDGETDDAAKGKAKRPVLNVTKKYSAAKPLAPTLDGAHPTPTVIRTPASKPKPAAKASKPPSKRAADTSNAAPKSFKVKKRAK